MTQDGNYWSGYLMSISDAELFSTITEQWPHPESFSEWPHQIFSFNLFGVKLRRMYFLKAPQTILTCSQVWSRKGGIKRRIYWDKAEDLWDKDLELCNPTDWVLILDAMRSMLLDLRL